MSERNCEKTKDWRKSCVPDHIKILYILLSRTRCSWRVPGSGVTGSHLHFKRISLVVKGRRL